MSPTFSASYAYNPKNTLVASHKETQRVTELDALLKQLCINQQKKFFFSSDLVPSTTRSSFPILSSHNQLKQSYRTLSPYDYVYDSAQQPKVIRDLLNYGVKKKSQQPLIASTTYPYVSNKNYYSPKYAGAQNKKQNASSTKELFFQTNRKTVPDKKLVGDTHSQGIQWLFDRTSAKSEMFQGKHIDEQLKLKIQSSNAQYNNTSDNTYGHGSNTHVKNSFSRVDVMNPTVAALLSSTSLNQNPEMYYTQFPYVPTKILEQSLWSFTLPEDNIDEEFLFGRYESQRRKNFKYLSHVKRLHDLHIVIPICIPYGTILVEDPLGANFYVFDKDKHSGAHILFGKGIVTSADSKKSFLNQNEPQQYSHTLSPSLKQSVANNCSKLETKYKMGPACDVWASFLHIRLGTIYNLTEEQLLQIVERFKSAFDPEFCYFYVPISVDCQGLYPSTDVSISQRATRPTNRYVPKERYETRGIPTTENDAKRLRMLRRYLKRFALSLVTECGFNQPSYYSTYNPDITSVTPHPCIELHDNARISTLKKGGLKIVVREWSRLDDPEIFKKIWNKQLASSAIQHGVADTVWTKVLENKDIPSARTFLGELRLEFNHLRMVDPRWPNELILGRRIADCNPLSEVPVLNSQAAARFVFCSRIRSSKVEYIYADENNDYKTVALKSRLSELYKTHLLQYDAQAVTQFLSQQEQQLQTPCHSKDTKQEEQLVSSTNNKENELQNKLPSAENLLVTKKNSQTLTSTVQDCNCHSKPLDFESSKHQNPPQQQHITVCKFFSSGGCARAENCFFLHPADPLLESTFDVRYIMPQHPKYF